MRKRAIKIADFSADDPQREKILLREKAVKQVQAMIYLGKETALKTVSAIMRVNHVGFKCGANSLRKWNKKYMARGLDGLVDQKRGHCGRPKKRKRKQKLKTIEA